MKTYEEQWYSCMHALVDVSGYLYTATFIPREEASAMGSQKWSGRSSNVNVKAKLSPCTFEYVEVWLHGSIIFAVDGGE
jgi:hypothetical protein